MIMVLDLLRNIFIIMFFILMALEIMVLLSMIFLYRTPLQGNTDQIEKASSDNTFEILNSFNFLFLRKHYQIETDLLLIAKHLHSIYLTLNDINEAYPTYQKTSLFVKSYKDCFIGNDFSKDTTFVKNPAFYNMTFPYENYNVTNEVFTAEQLATYYNLNEESIVKSFMSAKAPNYLSIISRNGFVENADFNGFAYDTYLCYAVSILKSMFIRDAIFERKNPLVDRYLIFLSEKYIFQYPIDFINFKKTVSFRYFNTTDAKCNNATLGYQGQNCFTTFQNMDYAKYTDKIQFENPKFSMSGYGNVKYFYKPLF